MLRRLTHIAAILLFLVSTIGIPISNHYCGAKLVSVSINHEVGSCCSGMQKACKCCKNEFHFYKIQNEYVTGQISQIDPILSISFLSDLFLLHSNMIRLEGSTDVVSFLYAPYLLPCHEHAFVSCGGLRAPPYLAYFIC